MTALFPPLQPTPNQPTAQPLPQANRAQIQRWLAEHVIDPNDPRNAPLLELLKAQVGACACMVS
jgi:hypothetical protein